MPTLPTVSPTRLRSLFFVLGSAAAGLYIFGLLWHQLQLFGNVILIFFSAWLISFILSPAVHWLEKRHVAHGLAVALVYVGMLLLLVGFGALLMPIFAGEVHQIAGRIVDLSTPAHARQLTDQFIALLVSFGFSPANAHQILNQVTHALGAALQGIGPSLSANALGIITGVSNALLYSFITLIISLYMVLDGRRIATNLIARLPTAWQPDARLFQTHVTRVFGGFIRSQLLIGLSYAVLTWVSLAFLGIPSGVIVALVAGVLMIVPFVGPFLALLPPMALVLLELPSDALVRTEIILFVELFVAQQIVMQGLAPRIMSYGVGVHPIWLFAALFIGAQEGGIWGAFFAAPIAALIVVVATTAYDRWARTSPLFDHATAVPPTIEATPVPVGNGLSKATLDTTPQPALTGTSE